jgi:hypothetical protein
VYMYHFTCINIETTFYHIFVRDKILFYNMLLKVVKRIKNKTESVDLYA